MPLYGKIVVIKRNGADGAHFPLAGPSCLFGRSNECDIRITLPNVSKEHARIDVNQDCQIYLTNLSQVNPTLLNGTSIKQTSQVNHKDVFTIIDRSFRFEFPPGSPFGASSPVQRSPLKAIAPKKQVSMATKMESLLECPICLGSFDDPRVLACLHTLCRKCLDQYVSARAVDSKFNCPSCRLECQVPEGGTAALPKNFLVNSMKEILQQQADQQATETKPRECHNNKKGKPPRTHTDATIFCADCAKFFCKSCEDNHLLFDEDHHFTPASDVTPSVIQAAETKRRSLK